MKLTAMLRLGEPVRPDIHQRVIMQRDAAIARADGLDRTIAGLHSTADSLAVANAKAMDEMRARAEVAERERVRISEERDHALDLIGARNGIALTGMLADRIERDAVKIVVAWLKSELSDDCSEAIDKLERGAWRDASKGGGA